jgi:hypothetical protein
MPGVQAKDAAGIACGEMIGEIQTQLFGKLFHPSSVLTSETRRK